MTAFRRKSKNKGLRFFLLILFCGTIIAEIHKFKIMIVSQKLDKKKKSIGPNYDN